MFYNVFFKSTHLQESLICWWLDSKRWSFLGNPKNAGRNELSKQTEQQNEKLGKLKMDVKLIKCHQWSDIYPIFMATPLILSHSSTFLMGKDLSFLFLESHKNYTSPSLPTLSKLRQIEDSQSLLRLEIKKIQLIYLWLIYLWLGLESSKLKKKTFRKKI